MRINQIALFGLTLAVTLMGTLAQAGEFPDNWYWERPEEHTRFEGLPAPELKVGDWVGGKFNTKKMAGDIVVINFWATWSDKCIEAMPVDAKLAKQYAGENVKVIGVCVSGDSESMPDLVKNNGGTYPNAFARGDQVATDWPVLWYPTYAVVDAQGVVRAIGLKPDKIEDVIEALLTEQAVASGKARIRPTWLEGTAEKRARLKTLEEKAEAPPALQVENWINSEGLSLDELKGKVVVIDFWATWSKPCIKAIEYHNELVDKYAADGLVIIGVCATHKGEFMADTVTNHGINYPVCVDKDNKTNTAYGVNGFPDYYLIDRAGNLRIADCANASLEDAIRALLAEKAEAENEDGPGDAEAE